MGDNVWDNDYRGIQENLGMILILLIFKLLITINANITINLLI